MSILTFTVTPRGATDVTVMMVVLKSFESSTLWTSFCSYSRVLNSPFKGQKSSLTQYIPTMNPL